MNVPSFLIPYIVGFSAGGMAALACKAAVYCFFQRPSGIRQRSLMAIALFAIALLAVALHVLASIAAIVVSLLILPRQGLAWKTHVWVYFLYAAVWSIAIEGACLGLLRLKLPLKWIGLTVIAANVVYYLGLVIGMAVFSGMDALTRIQ
jgi:hypothetical protein